MAHEIKNILCVCVCVCVCVCGGWVGEWGGGEDWRGVIHLFQTMCGEGEGGGGRWEEGDSRISNCIEISSQ